MNRSTQRNKIRGWSIWFSGALVMSGLWMMDEIQTMITFGCNRIQDSFCGYPIPLLGVWPTYNAEGLAWSMILIGLFAGFWSSGLRWKHATHYRIVTQEEYDEMFPK
ncbi:MAG TPA: hypothetical protein VEP90_18395 [Methylomirabilota bacterium]|nr:hypothetical protein [Methylomirabilota bacterium]